MEAGKQLQDCLLSQHGSQHSLWSEASHKNGQWRWLLQRGMLAVTPEPRHQKKGPGERLLKAQPQINLTTQWALQRDTGQ